jgi:hypothetical protein
VASGDPAAYLAYDTSDDAREKHDGWYNDKQHWSSVPLGSPIKSARIRHLPPKFAGATARPNPQY